jgi:hypothetical protein
MHQRGRGPLFDLEGDMYVETQQAEKIDLRQFCDGQDRW